MTPHYCLICHHAIAHAGAECVHCRSRASAGTAPPLLVLSGVFAVLVLLFAVTAGMTQSYQGARRARRQVHLDSGARLSGSGAYEEAAAQYRDALRYGRSDSAARLGLAQALIRLGSFSEARYHLLDLRAADPTDAVVSDLLGEIAAREGRVDEAASYYRTAIYGRWPSDPEGNRLRVRFDLVELLEGHGDNLQAVSELAELLEEAPDDSLRARIARRLLAVGASEKAAAVFEELTQAHPDDADAYRGLGESEFARAHYLSARTAFSRSLALDPTSVETFSWLRLSGRVVDLDPTYRRVGTQERYRRSVELVRRALAEVERCSPEATPAPDAATPTGEGAGPVERARQRLAGSERRQGENVVEENISLAEELWAIRPAACRGQAPVDEPLRLVLEKLAQ